ncbi:hypothetical protein CNMCM5793_007950 [Aspergillus hiratsukae]|uniref:Protein kinase domain-containing protein n=1 Tax=Aspergillus hiratsukae TaxID=1194566 RepID=A0A8H6P6X3_9EURO|nr:hypothetical protein CNMCM5793_007950 [Aspergillus hiratsukae]
MKSIRNAGTRLFSSLHRKPLPVPPPGPLLPQDEPVDEEICPGYNSKRFYPAKPGEVLANRYQILVKVGWGVSSTVWFARDMRGHESEPENAVALKITNTNGHPADEERQIEAHIARTDHPTALVRSFGHFRNGLRLADLKLENIMVTFEDPAVLEDFMNSQFDQPMQYKIDSTGRPVYRCHNDFGPLRNLVNIPKIVDFGLATRLDCDDWGIYPIQPDHYRAPEVILGCGWRMSADIWNLGVLLWDIMQGKELFQQVYDKQGQYDAKAHLAEILGLFGSPPTELIARAQSMLGYKWPEPIRREDGEVCECAEQYFGGPFFNEHGRFLHDELIPDRNLEDTVPFLKEKDRENFLVILRMMLAWLPEERKTAGELMEHPFLRLR